MYNAFVTGKFVYLRHPTEEDVYGKWHEWFSDEETTKYLMVSFWPNSKEEQLNFYRSLLTNKNRMVLSIVDIKSDKHIGVCNLSAISWIHRYCEHAYVIGEKEYRKGSYAFESVSLLLKIAFLRLNLRIVRGEYIRANEFTEKIMKVLGFKEVGEFKNLCWVDGGYDDIISVMLNREDWLKRNMRN